MTLPIIKYGDPILRQKGEIVGEITPEIKNLVAHMFDTMYVNNGVGLSAHQVGKAIQLMVIDTKIHIPMVLINPTIKPLSEACMMIEGCLSFPDKQISISRPERIEVTALNLDGQSLTFECGEMLARVIQHEYDHLQGKLFIDY